MKKKRGQVTLFIVIGLILLLAAGLTIYLFSLKEAKPIEQAELPIVQQIPQEAEPIREYIKACVYETAKQGLIKLGQQGGYISTTGLGYNPFTPTEGEAVQFSKNSELKIPYWLYMSSPNNCFSDCEFDSKRPTIKQVQEQLEKYIDTNLKTCIAEFRPFKEYEFYEKQAPRTEITMGEQNIAVYTEYPITARKGTITFEIPDYATTIELNFKEIYDTATKLTDLQSQYGYLEKYTNQLITIFSRLDSKALPPTSELDINLGAGTIWTEPQVNEKITQMLASYIPLLQVPGTINYKNRNPPIETTSKELYKTLYNRNMAVLLDKDMKQAHPSLAISFNYLDWWKPYSSICPGQVCQAETATSTIPMLGMVIGIQRYNFAYDLSFPVLIEISNPYAFKGQGYSFRFFLEHNMRANQPMKTDYQRIQMMDITTRTMMCKKQHWKGNYTIKVKNGRTQEPVNNAQIAFNCGTESCTIGTTNQQGELKTQLPHCLGGIILTEKNQYHPENTIIDTSKEQEQTITIILEPYRKIDISTMKWLIKKQGPNNWELDTASKVHPERDEETMIIMEKQTQNLEEPFTAMASVCGGLNKAKIPCGTPPKDNSKNIRILPGKYNVKIYNFRYPQPAVIIPKDKRCVHAGPLKDPKCYYIPEENIIFDKAQPLPTGTAEFELELTKDQLDSAEEITFNYLYFALDKLPKSNRKIEDLDQISRMAQYSELYRTYLEPEIK